jgi:hypothetical protein
MKKYAILLAALAMVASFAACQKKEEAPAAEAPAAESAPAPAEGETKPEAK